MEGNDIVKNALNIVEKKVRNLEKRKGKLDSYRKLIKDGKELSEEQKTAVSKMDYVENNLDFARELQKQFAQLSVEYQKHLKKQAKRDQLVQQEAQHSGNVSRVKEVLELQNLMENLSEDVRTDFLNGSNGAVTLVPEDFVHIDEFYKLITPTAGDEVNMNDQTATASEHIVHFLEGSSTQVAGTSYKALQDLVNKIKGCGYFSQSADEAVAADVSEEEEKAAGEEAEEGEESEETEEVVPAQPATEEGTNGIHAEEPTTQVTNTQPGAEPVTNISSIEANEHGLNFLSESAVETKPQVDQTQQSTGAPITEGSGFDAAPAGNNWEEHGNGQDASGEADFETVQSNNGFGRGGRGGFGRGGGRGGGGRGGNFNRRGGGDRGDRGRRGGGRGGFGGGQGNREGGFQRQDGNYRRGGGERRGGRGGFGQRGGTPRGGQRGSGFPAQQ